MRRLNGGRPHGDPIPRPRRRQSTPQFLRNVEDHGLKPGRSIAVEYRDDDAVVLRDGERRVTVGMGAASKLLVNVAMAVT